MSWSLGPKDPLVEMEEARSIGQLDQHFRALAKWQMAHLRWHRRVMAGLLAGFPLASILVNTYFDSRNAIAREQCTAVARHEVDVARSEHESIRTSIQGLTAKQQETDRELTRIAASKMAEKVK